MPACTQSTISVYSVKLLCECCILFDFSESGRRQLDPLLFFFFLPRYSALEFLFAEDLPQIVEFFRPDSLGPIKGHNRFVSYHFWVLFALPNHPLQLAVLFLQFALLFELGLIFLINMGLLLNACIFATKL